MFNIPTETISMKISGVEIRDINRLKNFENCQRKHFRRKTFLCNQCYKVWAEVVSRKMPEQLFLRTSVRGCFSIWKFVLTMKYYFRNNHLKRVLLKFCNTKTFLFPWKYPCKKLFLSKLAGVGLQTCNFTKTWLQCRCWILLLYVGTIQNV